MPPVGEVSVWRPAAGEPRAVFVALHGIQSNQHWFEPLGKELAQRGYALWAYTRPSLAPKPVADAKTWEEWCDQLEAVGDAARIRGRPLVALGVSWGARPVLASVIRRPDHWSGAVLLNPALKTRKDGAFLWRALCAGAPLLATTVLEIPLVPEDYTRNGNTHRHWLEPRQLTTRCTTRFFGRTAKLRGQADRRIEELRKPTLALLGGSDPLVLHDPVERLLKKADPRQLEVKTIDGGTHAMLVEREGEIADVIDQWQRRTQFQANP